MLQSQVYLIQNVIVTVVNYVSKQQQQLQHYVVICFVGLVSVNGYVLNHNVHIAENMYHHQELYI